MKFVLLNDRDEKTTDGIFYVPDDADVELFIERCWEHFYSPDDDRSMLEIIKQDIPDGWIFMDYWNGLETVNY